MQANLADLIETELGKRWREPRCPTLRDLYEKRQEGAHRKDVRFAAWIAGAIYLSFSIADGILINDVFYYTLITRLIVVTIFIGIIDIQHRLKVQTIAIDKQCALGVIVAYTSWLWLTSCSEHHLSAKYYMTYGTIFMMILNLFFNFRFKMAVLSSGFIVVSFPIALMTIFSVSTDYVVAVGLLYVSSFGLTLFVNWKLNEERYRVFLNSLHAEIRHNEAAARGAALLRLSTPDALTGLAYPRATDDGLRRLWEDWQANGRSFAVILVDIDFFKRFNDRYGHQEGDRCLIAVADAMNQVAIQHRCSLGRFGGEEFIILAASESRDRMATIAEDLRRAVEDLRIPHGERPDSSAVVTVSVGAAFSCDVTGTKVERLVTEADRALYGAKAKSRNCVQVFDKNDPNNVDLDESVADLVRSAIAQDRVSLVYQPIWSARSGGIAAAEALMRLTTASGKAISPAVFIPVAERTGAIVELGKWAIRTACREIIANDLVALVSVNVSAVQLKAPGFALSVAVILGETGVAPHRIALEVTEGLEIETQPEILQTLEALKQLGVEIWLDDFGTGFAGLSCIRKIDFDAVKIDRSFLHATKTSQGTTMLKDIFSLIRNAGHKIVVEGIENEKHMSLLKKHSIDLMQGFHLGQPMSARLLQSLLREEIAASPRPTAAHA